MTRYADPERCPDCQSAIAYGANRCPHCDLNLEGPLAARLFATLSEADTLLASLREVGPPEAASGPVVAGPAPALAKPRRSVLSVTSVPKILLGLGALCLLVAALVFLAVAWSAMGVAGRTATLVVFTVVAAGLAAWAARHELRAAAESLSVVALGLLAFDMFGAHDAGWFGDIDTAGFVVLLGGVLLLAGSAASIAVRRTPVRVLVGAELYATVGLCCVVGGAAAADWLATSAALTLAVVLTAAVALAARSRRLTVLTAGAALTSLTTWLLLTLLGWERAVANPSLRELWLELEGWPLLAAAALVAGVAGARRLPMEARVSAVAVAAVLLAGTVLAPVTDATPTQATLAVAVLVAVVSALAWVVPRPWARAVTAPAALGLGALAWAAGWIALDSLVRILEAGAAWWSGGAGDAFAGTDTRGLAPWLLPTIVLAGAAATASAQRCFPAVRRTVTPLSGGGVLAAVLSATVTLTAAGYPVPMWAVLAVLMVTGGGFVARSLQPLRTLPLLLGAASLALGLLLALHAEWLTLPALLVCLVAALAVHLRAPRLEVSVAAGVPLVVAVAGIVWTVGALTAVPQEWAAAAAILALAVLVLVGPFLDSGKRTAARDTYARLGVELGALAVAGAVSAAGVSAASAASDATWLAGYLTLIGATASAMALLRADRRAAGWLAGFLLAAASWVRLGDLGVEAPEAYTLPSAVALLLVGLVRLRGASGASTLALLSPGLTLALVPSLLWVLADPVTLRSVLLGAACLSLVVGGVHLGWSAPVLHGGAVGSMLVLRHAVPVAEAVPQWALIGIAGALLLTMGVTWERRVHDARAVAGYMRHLR